MVDALGNPLAFFLTPGQAHDLEGADALLPQMKADTVLADKAFDADERVIEPLLAAGKTPVIPPADRQIKELISSGKARNDDDFCIIYCEGMPCGGDRAACPAQTCRDYG